MGVLCPEGVSVRGSLSRGDLCPGGSLCAGGLCPEGASVQEWVFVQGGLCEINVIDSLNVYCMFNWDVTDIFPQR